MTEVLFARQSDMLVLQQQQVGVVFASLPTASGARGTLAVVTDSSTATWGATISGSGSNVVLAWSNGSNWTVVGK